MHGAKLIGVVLFWMPRMVRQAHCLHDALEAVRINHRKFVDEKDVLAEETATVQHFIARVSV